MDSKEKTKGEEDTQVNKARLTVTCRNLKSIEKCKDSSDPFFRAIFFISTQNILSK